MAISASPIASDECSPCVPPDGSAGFLVCVGQELAKSLDYKTTLQSVARLAVPFLADACFVQIVEPDGQLRLIANAHVDDAKERLLREAIGRRRAGVSPMAVRAVRRREPVLVHRLSESLLNALAQEERMALDPWTLDAIHEARSESSVNVPMIVRSQVVGVLSLARLEGSPPFGSKDVRLIKQLARQCAQAIDNARLYREAREAARARDELLAATSHELRTPLSEIKGFVSTLLRSDVTWDEATRSDFLQEIERDADRLDALISDLLDMSQLASGGQLRFDRSPRSPAVLVCGGLDRVRLRVARSAVDIDSTLGKLPLVYVDPNRIEQVIANLVENATKYAPGSPIYIRAGLAEDGSTVDLVIEDDGPGIASQDIEHIFDRLYRGRATAGSKTPGSGLGLTIARTIVEAHGGRIRAENRPAGGARFVISLPVDPSVRRSDR